MYILWDFDGTLADAPRLWTRATQSLLHRSGLTDIDLEIIRRELSYGFPWHTPEISHEELFNEKGYWEFLNNKISSAIVASGVKETTTNHITKGWRDEILHNYGYQLLPKAKDVLKSLTSYGYSHVIASSHIPELIEVLNHFEMVHTSVMIGYEKPHLLFFENIIKDLCRDRIALMIGDSLDRDIKGAKDSGIKSVWLNRNSDPGTGSIEPDFEISSLQDILDIINRM